VQQRCAVHVLFAAKKPAASIQGSSGGVDRHGGTCTQWPWPPPLQMPKQRTKEWRSKCGEGALKSNATDTVN